MESLTLYGTSWQNQSPFVPLKIVINEAINSGITPQQWKHTIMHPILKNAKAKPTVDNIRPIELGSTMSKIVQKIVKIKIDLHMDKNDLYSRSQFGFRKKPTNQ